MAEAAIATLLDRCGGSSQGDDATVLAENQGIAAMYAALTF